MGKGTKQVNLSTKPWSVCLNRILMDEYRGPCYNGNPGARFCQNLLMHALKSSDLYQLLNIHVYKFIFLCIRTRRIGYNEQRRILVDGVESQPKRGEGYDSLVTYWSVFSLVFL